MDIMHLENASYRLDIYDNRSVMKTEGFDWHIDHVNGICDWVPGSRVGMC